MASVRNGACLLLLGLVVPSAGFSLVPSQILSSTRQPVQRNGVLGVRSLVGPALLQTARHNERLRPALRASKEGDFARMERVKFKDDLAIYTEEMDGTDVGVVQAAAPLTPKNPYFEVEVVDGGTNSWIGVGIADTEYDLDKQPGWSPISVGFHADDGCHYKCPRPDEQAMNGKPMPMPLLGKPAVCEKGDVMGCGIEFDDRGKEPTGLPRRVYFTKNGMYLGSVFLEKQFSSAVYPTIGFNSPGSRAKINLAPSSASVQVVHAAQSFGTNQYAINIVDENIKAGADVNTKDGNGRTALHMASAYGATPIAMLLLEKGADPDIQDNMGLTPLHMSSGYVRPSTVKLLLENGADPELLTKRGERALDVIRNMRNATQETSMGGLVKDKRYPLMTEIMTLLESVTENPDEWITPAPIPVDPKQEEVIKDAMEKAKELVADMKKDPEKMKELEQAMELMKDPEFQKKVKQYASDPEGMKKLMDEYKDVVK